MANEVKIEVYTLSFRAKRKKDPIPLAQILGDDMIPFFKTYIESVKEFSVNEENKRSINYDSSKLSIKSEDRILSGVIESGDYGLGGKLINRKTREVSGQKHPDDLDIKPFYFLISLPLKAKKGVVMLQRTGIHGINGVFIKHLGDYIKARFPDIMVDFAPIISKALAKRFIKEGSIKEIVLRRYDLPPNLEDKLGLQDHRDVAMLEVRIRAQARKKLPYNQRIDNFVNGKNASLFDLPGLSGLGFDGKHKSHVKIKLGKSVRTVDLSDTGEIRPYYDITDNLSFGSDGHPTFDSIDVEVKQLLEDLRDDIGLKNTNAK